jgi:hypothetical protein
LYLGVRLGYVFCGIPKSKLFEVRTCNFQKNANLMRKFLYFFGLPAFWRVIWNKPGKAYAFLLSPCHTPLPPPPMPVTETMAHLLIPLPYILVFLICVVLRQGLAILASRSGGGGANSYDNKKSLVIFPSFHVSCKQKHWRKHILFAIFLWIYCHLSKLYNSKETQRQGTR